MASLTSAGSFARELEDEEYATKDAEDTEPSSLRRSAFSPISRVHITHWKSRSPPRRQQPLWMIPLLASQSFTGSFAILGCSLLGNLGKRLRVTTGNAKERNCL